MKLPSGVEVWQPMQVTARLLYATSIVFQVEVSRRASVVPTSVGTRTCVTLSSPTAKPESNVLPTVPVPALVEPVGDQ